MSTSPTPEQRKLVRTIIYVSGLAFLATGCVLLLKPDLLGFDENTNMIFAGALIFAGFADFVIARFILKGHDRR